MDLPVHGGILLRPERRIPDIDEYDWARVHRGLRERIVQLMYRRDPSLADDLAQEATIRLLRTLRREAPEDLERLMTTWRPEPSRIISGVEKTWWWIPRIPCWPSERRHRNPARSAITRWICSTSSSESSFASRIPSACAYVDRMATLIVDEPDRLPADAASLARSRMRALQSSVEGALEANSARYDDYTVAHLEDVRDRLQLALDASLSLSPN